MKLYIGNLPWSIDDNSLKDLFAPFGNIEESVLIKDRYSGRSKGFGFVTFSDDASAKKAIAEMHEKKIDGRPLTVSEAKPMVPRDNSQRYENRNNSHKSAEVPMADPSTIDNEVEDDIESETPEVADDDSNEKSIRTDEEAKKDASTDASAAEEAVDAEESTDSESQGCSNC